MAASLHRWSLFAFLFICSLEIIFTYKDSPKIDNVITAIERLVHFYSENFAKINLDGVYGLRVLEGQLEVIIQDYKSGELQHVNPKLITYLQGVLSETTNISNRAIPFLKHQDPQYYNSLRPLVHEPWKQFKPHRRTNPKHRWTRLKRDVHLDEEFSDKCMGQLMGTWKEGAQPCEISDECASFMTQQGLAEYGITHQLLYVLLAEKSGCLSKLETWVNKNRGGGATVDEVVQELCTNNLVELHRLVGLQEGVIIPRYQDLFMEQQFVCPSLGFVEFLHEDLLKQILSWQKPNGCFGKMGKSELRKKAEEAGFAKESVYEYDDDRGDGEEGKDEEWNKDDKGYGQNLIKQQMENKQDLQNPNFMQNGQPLIFNNQDRQAVQQNNQLPGSNMQVDGAQVMNQVVRNQVGQGNVNLGNPGQGMLDGAQGGVNQGAVQGPMMNQGQGQIQPHGGPGRHRRLLELGSHGDHDQVAVQHWMGRRLLEEKDLAGGCLAHKTGVAAGALSQYLRFMLYPWPSDLADIRLDRPALVPPAFQSISSAKNNNESKQSIHIVKKSVIGGKDGVNVVQSAGVQDTMNGNHQAGAQANVNGNQQAGAQVKKDINQLAGEQRQKEEEFKEKNNGEDYDEAKEGEVHGNYQNYEDGNQPDGAGNKGGHDDMYPDNHPNLRHKRDSKEFAGGDRDFDQGYDDNKEGVVVDLMVTTMMKKIRKMMIKTSQKLLVLIKTGRQTKMLTWRIQVTIIMMMKVKMTWHIPNSPS